METLKQRGRPKVDDNKKVIKTSVSLRPSTIQKLNDYEGYHEINASRSALIDFMICEFIKMKTNNGG